MIVVLPFGTLFVPLSLTMSRILYFCDHRQVGRLVFVRTLNVEIRTKWSSCLLF